MRTSVFFLLISLVASGAAYSDGHDERQCRLNVSGTFSHYKLAVSRSKEWCYAKDRNDDQCTLEYSVHGLWPQCDRGYPRDCALPDRSLADAIDADEVRRITPSAYLIKHEWQKHGTCSGLKRSKYFDLAGRLFDKAKAPPLKPGEYTYEGLIKALTGANPALSAASIELACDEDQKGPRASVKTLDEIRYCFDAEGNFTACKERESSCRKLRKIVVRY